MKKKGKMTEEERVKHPGAQRLKEFWRNLTPEQRQEMSRKLSEAQKRFWNEMTPEQERKHRRKRGRQIRKIWLSKPAEERKRVMAIAREAKRRKHAAQQNNGTKPGADLQGRPQTDRHTDGQVVERNAD